MTYSAFNVQYILSNTSLQAEQNRTETAYSTPEFALKQSTNSMFYVTLSCSCYNKGTAIENDNKEVKINVQTE